jgi:hypothetical protein
MSELIGDTVRLQVRNVEVREVNTPLLEVPTDDLVAIFGQSGSASDVRQGEQK